MEKYIPVPEENFFRDYLELEANRKIITRNDLDINTAINPVIEKSKIDYQTLEPTVDHSAELNLVRKLHQQMLHIKNTFEFPDETDINNFLIDIKKREYELDVSDNIQELSEMFVYNQHNRFNNRLFKYDIEKHNTIDKNAVIDTRMFEFGNLNLNYFAALQPLFIHKAHIKIHHFKLPYGIFWCKLHKYTHNTTTTILDNSKDLYFYHTMIKNKPMLYSYRYNDQNIYLASNNFAYEYREYNEKEALVVLHIDNKFAVYDKTKL